MKKVLECLRPIVIMEISDEVVKSSGIHADELLTFMTGLNYIPKGIDKEGNTIEWGKDQEHANVAFFPEEQELK